jgi:hypothetical protein
MAAVIFQQIGSRDLMSPARGWMIRPQWTLRIVIRVRDSRSHDQSSGTQSELTEVRALLRRGGVMVVEGRAGLGKTAMLDAACALRTSKGLASLHSDCSVSSQETLPPYSRLVPSQS